MVNSLTRSEDHRINISMNKHCFRWSFNKKQLQSSIGSFCGFYCCMYCLLRCRWVNLNGVVNMSTNDNGCNGDSLKLWIVFSFSFLILPLVLVITFSDNNFDTHTKFVLFYVQTFWSDFRIDVYQQLTVTEVLSLYCNNFQVTWIVYDLKHYLYFVVPACKHWDSHASHGSIVSVQCHCVP